MNSGVSVNGFLDREEETNNAVEEIDQASTRGWGRVNFLASANESGVDLGMAAEEIDQSFHEMTMTVATN